MEFVYKIVLIYVHLIISLVFVLYQFVAKLRRKLQELQLAFSASEAERVEKMTSQILGFLKLPSHVGIIINEERLSFSDIANIITWCLALGVPHISIYDGGGVMKAESQYLYKQSMKCKEKLLKDPSKYKLTFQHKDLQHQTNGVANGYRIAAETRVNLLSIEDGRQALVCATREISRRNEQKITSDVVSSHMTCMDKFPDPDLVVCFGSGYSLVGYSPWHVPFSEITFQESHHKYHLCQFKEVLEKFSKCDQRFGK